MVWFHSFILRIRTFMNPNKTKKISPGLAQIQRHKKDLRFMNNLLNVLRISTDKHNSLYFFQIGFTKLSSFQNFIVLFMINVLNVLWISTDKYNSLYFFQIGFTKLSSFQNFIVLCILYHRVLDLNLTLRMSSFLCLRILFGFFLCWRYSFF